MDEKLIRNLNSVGKAVFVDYFDTFKAYAEGHISKEDCIETLVTNGVSNNAGAVIRCSNAKALFDRGEVQAALTIIAQSSRLPLHIKKAAQNMTL